MSETGANRANLSDRAAIPLKPVDALSARPHRPSCSTYGSQRLTNDTTGSADRRVGHFSKARRGSSSSDQTYNQRGWNAATGGPTLLLPDEAHRASASPPGSQGLPRDLVRQATPRLRVMALLYAAIFFLADFFPALISEANRAILFSAVVRWLPGAISISVALFVAAVVSQSAPVASGRCRDRRRL